MASIVSPTLSLTTAGYFRAQLLEGIAGLDDGVNLAALGGNVRVGIFLAEFINMPLGAGGQRVERLRAQGARQEVEDLQAHSFWSAHRAKILITCRDRDPCARCWRRWSGCGAR